MSEKATWIDASSFSRSDADRTPRCWEFIAGRVRVSVFRHKRLDPETWYLTCDEIGFDTVDLRTNSVDDAKRVALQAVKRRLDRCVAVINEELSGTSIKTNQPPASQGGTNEDE